MPPINERHIARTYRSIHLAPALWYVSGDGGNYIDGHLTHEAGEGHVCYLPLPYDLDPSFPLKFRALCKVPAFQAQPSIYQCEVVTNGAVSWDSGRQFTSGGKTYLSDPFSCDAADTYTVYFTAAVSGTAQSLAVSAALTPVVAIPELVSATVTSEFQAGVNEPNISLQLKVLAGTPGVDDCWSSLTPGEEFVDLTTPWVPVAPLSATTKMCKTSIGSLTLASSTARGTSLSLWLKNTGTQMIHTYAVEVAYVPYIAGVRVSSTIAAPWS